MRTDRQQLGDRAEDLALRHLASAGLKLVQRIFRCRWGELDLIVSDETALVFVEVRYRKGARFGSAAETVDRRKQDKLVRAAQHFLQQFPQWASHPTRFDVIALGEPGRIEWIKNAFEA